MNNVVNKKQVIFSFIIPILVEIFGPFLLLWLIERRSLFTLFNQNIFFLIISFIIFGFGFLLFFACNWLFYSIGKGTLAPISKIETKSMVIKGPYKYVRNPMIISVLIILLAESLLFNSISILIYTGIAFLVNVIYMPLSEEKGLIARFGDEYLHYKENVRAWIPKFHPYIPNNLSGIKITLKTSRPGLVIGKGGKRIQEITDVLSSVYGIESPQIEVEEVKNSEVNAQIIAERLAYSLDRGRHYRRAGYYILRKVMDSGRARGVEVRISGKIDSPRAKKFILRAGAISKSGQAAQEGVDKGVAQSKQETGTLGVIVKIMRLDYMKGDRVSIKHEALKIAQLAKAKKKTESKRKVKYKIKEELTFLDEESGKDDDIDE